MVSGPECEAPKVCDITQTSCQAAVLELTACIRGDATPPLPEIRVIDEVGFRDELVEQRNADPPSEAGHFTDAVLVALHLLPPEADLSDALIDEEVKSVIAYYDTDDKRVTVVDRNEPSEQSTSMYELSHELTHYLQDRAIDATELRERFPHTVDGVEAEQCLVEGEAVVTSLRALSVLQGHRPSEIAWSDINSRLSGFTFADLSSANAPFAVAALELPYMFGTFYIEDVWNDYDRAHVDALFDEAPKAAGDWGDGYGRGAIKPSSVQPLDCAPPLAPTGFVLKDLDSFGVVGAMALLGAAHQQAAAVVGANVVGDAIAVYANDQTSEAIGAWRLRMTTASMAKDFASLIAPLGLAPQVFDREVLITVSSNADGQPFDADALASCPTLEELRPQQTPVEPSASLRRLLSRQWAGKRGVALVRPTGS
jgi:hypothetical protein